MHCVNTLQLCVALGGPFPGLCGKNCLHRVIGRAVGKAKQTVISLRVELLLTEEAEGAAWRGCGTRVVSKRVDILSRVLHSPLPWTSKGK